MSLATRIFSWTVFPVTITLAVGGTILCLRNGWEPAVSIGPSILAAYALIALLERIFPYQESWLHAKNDVGTDMAWFVTNSAMNRLVEPLLLGAGVALGAWLSGVIGLGLWPAEQPLLLQLALALVVAELFEYWFHRAMHETKWLWRFHATHHSAPRLYWMNAVRFHPVDYTLVGPCKLLPLALLGAPAMIFALVNVFAAVHGAFQHSNLQLRLGPLNWVFSMAELHRWHHSREIEEANHNYGGNLILWDIVFGTRWLPADREPPADIGLSYPSRFPTTFWSQLTSPVRWAEVE
jgi:sterol desaturase/sphingolipid hydroxylase (fatty acid hydroxylase superfamily)